MQTAVGIYENTQALSTWVWRAHTLKQSGIDLGAMDIYILRFFFQLNFIMFKVIDNLQISLQTWNKFS